VSNPIRRRRDDALLAAARDRVAKVEQQDENTLITAFIGR
jgi:hypothetical protein